MDDLFRLVCEDVVLVANATEAAEEKGEDTQAAADAAKDPKIIKRLKRHYFFAKLASDDKFNGVREFLVDIDANKCKSFIQGRFKTYGNNDKMNLLWPKDNVDADRITEMFVKRYPNNNHNAIYDDKYKDTDGGITVLDTYCEPFLDAILADIVNVKDMAQEFSYNCTPDSMSLTKVGANTQNPKTQAGGQSVAHVISPPSTAKHQRGGSWLKSSSKGKACLGLVALTLGLAGLSVE
jgi:hypothetical protein